MWQNNTTLVLSNVILGRDSFEKLGVGRSQDWQLLPRNVGKYVCLSKNEQCQIVSFISVMT